MRLSHQIEQFLIENPHTTVSAIAEWFGLSQWRCLDELAALEPFGVLVDPSGCVHIDEPAEEALDRKMAACGSSI
jgi:hypothetical protein